MRTFNVLDWRLAVSLAVLVLVCASGCNESRRIADSVFLRKRASVDELPTAEKSRLVTEATPVEKMPAAIRTVDGVLTLDGARRVALAGSPDIHAARARLEAALSRIDEARSFYAPQIGMLHNSTRTFRVPAQRTRLTSPIAPISNLPSINNLSLIDLVNVFVSQALGRGNTISTGNVNSFSDHSTTLTATWTIFDGFVRDARLRASRYGFLASAMALADAQRVLVHAVDTAYFQIQFATERLRIARADEAFSLRQLEDAQRRFESGKITRSDVLNFEVRVQAASAEVVAAMGLRDTGRVVLAELLAAPEAVLPDDVRIGNLAEETREDLAEPDPGNWLHKAMLNRPDLARAKHLRGVNSENVKLAKGQFSPELTLSGTWGYENLSNLRYSDDDQASGVAVELRWQLYTGGFRTSQLRRAKADWWEAAAQLEGKRLKVGAEVRTSIVGVRSAQEQVLLNRSKRASAEENRRVVEEEYAAGKASLVRLNEAQRDYVQADAELATARIQLRQAWTDLRAAASSYCLTGDATMAPATTSP